MVEPFSGHTGAVRAVVFSPDGSRFASCGALNGMLRIRRTNSGATELVLSGHRGPVSALAFLPGGVLVSAGHDRTVRGRVPDARLLPSGCVTSSR